MSWPIFWQKTTWQTQLLRPLGRLTCQVAAKRLRDFQQAPPAKVTQAKVIVVGNVVVGGSGKTPFILWLAEQLQQRGIRFGIVSRGYGGKSKAWPQRVFPESDARLVGDEPLLLAKQLQCPIAVSPKRVEAIQALANEDLEVIISDDGLQHFAMARDLEIILMDAERELGNGYCLPAGPLREAAHRMDAVDFVVWNGGQEQTWTMQLQPVCFRQVAHPEITLPLDAFAQQSVTAIAGIGNPARFFATLADLKIVAVTQAFADHQAYQLADFLGFNAEKPLLMTEKDAVKCRQFAKDNWWYLQVAPVCSPELAQAIFNRLDEN